MSPMKLAIPSEEMAQKSSTDNKQPELLSKFRINHPDQPGKISGIDITADDKILITDSWKQTITIYDQQGQCQFTKDFDHNVWDCACLGDGYYAVLGDDCIKVFTNRWSFCQKIRVCLPNPRQLTADSDGFFIILDADCKNVASYHAKTGSLLSTFPTDSVTGYIEYAVPDSTCLRRGQRSSVSKMSSKFEPMGTSLGVNSKDLIYIADTTKNAIRVYSHYGVERQEHNYPSNSRWQLAKPLGLCIGSEDSIVVADTNNDRVLKFSQDWSQCVTILDKVDGLTRPVAVALTASKKLVIVDSDTNVYVVQCD